jgi:isocitrate dehydrogenase
LERPGLSKENLSLNKGIDMQTVRGRFNGATVELLDDTPSRGEAYVLVTFLEGSLETAAARSRRPVSIATFSLDRYSGLLRRRLGAEQGGPPPEPRPFTVGEAMTRKLIAISAEETVARAMHVMHQHGITSILVEPDGRGGLGIMTMRDVLRRIVSASRSPEEVRVGEIASRPLIYVSPELSLRECSKLMIDSNIRRAVVREHGRPVGIISDTDIFQIVEERGWGPEQE